MYVTFTLKMVMAANTKMLEQLQQMKWLKTIGLSYQYQAMCIWRG